MTTNRTISNLIGGLLLVGSLCQAAVSSHQITFTWDPVPAPDYLIDRYEFYVTTNLVPIRFQNGGPTNWLYIITGRTNTTITVSNLPPGCWQAMVRVVDTNGIAGDLSNAIIFLIPPPLNLRIQAAVETSDDPNGPWVELIRHPVDVMADDGRKFFRSVTYIERL